MKGKNSYKTWLLDQNNFQGSIPIKQIKSAIKKKKIQQPESNEVTYWVTQRII